MMAEYKPLSIHDAVDLAAIVNAAIHTSHVTWASTSWAFFCWVTMDSMTGLASWASSNRMKSASMTGLDRSQIFR